MSALITTELVALDAGPSDVGGTDKTAVIRPLAGRVAAAGRATAPAVYLPALRLLHTLAVQPNGRLLLGGARPGGPAPTWACCAT